ncbi:hypothetical protein SDC9_153926 [bioreactor metagenome]|uniref:Uncharacterized protein n=1 Tax=bioreactor metagenome TaxID=1076179 RepID=A0A645EYW7_9ZZZZ
MHGLGQLVAMAQTAGKQVEEVADLHLLPHRVSQLAPGLAPGDGQDQNRSQKEQREDAQCHIGCTHEPNTVVIPNRVLRARLPSRFPPPAIRPADHRGRTRGKPADRALG